uniref:Peroxisome assembly protein 12 n=1 Tax=Heterorhabditis bacteriophora TaxID=37862 RepID=A0A1I7X5W1_HETBA
MSIPLRAAHLSSIHSVGEQPSIFDILSQESLMKALKPAIGYLMKYLATTYPRLFLSSHRRFDEFYLLFDLFLQNQYLKKYGASFSENFYAMKRIVQCKGTMPLAYWDRMRSLLILNFCSLFRRLFVLIWPWCQTLMSTITIILQLGITNRFWRFFLSLPGVFNRLFGYGLFFVQFIDFIYNSDFGAEILKKNISWKVPPAPHKLLTEKSVQLLDTNKCPLCLRKRENDTALSVSGYVFCYKCIDTYLKKYNTCPVTGLPASSQQLIRLYIQ